MHRKVNKKKKQCDEETLFKCVIYSKTRKLCQVDIAKLSRSPFPLVAQTQRAWLAALFCDML